MTYEDYEHAEHLQHEPAVARNAGVVLQQFSLRAADVRCNVDGIGVDALHGFPLLRDHLRELCEDLTELRNGRLDRFDGCGTSLDVAIL